MWIILGRGHDWMRWFLLAAISIPVVGVVTLSQKGLWTVV